jgi:hypothetical protein
VVNAGFSDEVVAAAFDVAALPAPTPLQVIEHVMTEPARCLACGGSGQYPLTVTDEGAPLSWRNCPACKPSSADLGSHEAAVAQYGKDHF